MVDICESCVEMFNHDTPCKFCAYGNPCLGCRYHDDKSDICLYNGDYCSESNENNNG